MDGLCPVGLSHGDLQCPVDRLSEVAVPEDPVELLLRQTRRVNAEPKVQNEGLGSVGAAEDSFRLFSELKHHDADLEQPGKDAYIVNVG